MTHIRVDDEPLNANSRFACGVGPELPEGDRYVFDGEVSLHRLVDCPACAPFKGQLGTPLSELSGRPGHKGFGRFVQIAETWGH